FHEALEKSIILRGPSRTEGLGGLGGPCRSVLENQCAERGRYLRAQTYSQKKWARRGQIGAHFQLGRALVSGHDAITLASHPQREVNGGSSSRLAQELWQLGDVGGDAALAAARRPGSS